MVKLQTGLTINGARVYEQAVISAYTLSGLMNARREISLGNVKGFVNEIGNVSSLIRGVAEDELLNLMGR